MIVVVLMMAMVVMVVTKRLTTEIMKVIKMIMLLAFGIVGFTFAGRRSVISMSSNLWVSTSFWWIAIRSS